MHVFLHYCNTFRSPIAFYSSLVLTSIPTVPPFLYSLLRWELATIFLFSKPFFFPFGFSLSLCASTGGSYSHQFSLMSVKLQRAVQWNLYIMDILESFIRTLIIKVFWLSRSWSVYNYAKAPFGTITKPVDYACMCCYFQVFWLTGFTINLYHVD